MNFAPILDLGMGLAQGWAQGYAARGQAKASNEIREARNSVERGKARLAAQMQALNNSRILARAGQIQDGMMRSIVRTQKAQTRSGFEQSIQQAEQMGAAAAAASASGAGGTAINAASSVAAMSIARQRQYMQDSNEDQTYEQFQQMANVMGDAALSLGNTYYMPSQDFSRDTAGSWTDYLLGALAGKKDSMQTFLGELGAQPKTANPNIGPPFLSPWAGQRATPTALPAATSYAVKPQTALMPTPLTNITF